MPPFDCDPSIGLGNNANPVGEPINGARSGILAAQLGPIASETNIASAPNKVRSFMQIPFILVSKISPREKGYNATATLSDQFSRPTRFDDSLAATVFVIPRDAMAATLLAQVSGTSYACCGGKAAETIGRAEGYPPLDVSSKPTKAR